MLDTVFSFSLTFSAFIDLTSINIHTANVDVCAPPN
jgi:hypothetical protein